MAAEVGDACALASLTSSSSPKLIAACTSVVGEQTKRSEVEDDIEMIFGSGGNTSPHSISASGLKPNGIMAAVGGKRFGSSVHSVADKLKDRLTRKLDAVGVDDCPARKSDDPEEMSKEAENQTGPYCPPPASGGPSGTSRSQYHSIQQLCLPSTINNNTIQIRTSTCPPIQSATSFDICNGSTSSSANQRSRAAMTSSPVGGSDATYARQSTGSGSVVSDDDDVDADDADYRPSMSVDGRSQQSWSAQRDEISGKTTSAGRQLSRPWSTALDRSPTSQVYDEYRLQEAKRARVENIVNNMRTSPGNVDDPEPQNAAVRLELTASGRRNSLSTADGRRQRRKQSVPQHQYDGRRPVGHLKRQRDLDDDEEEMSDAEQEMENDEDGEREWSSFGARRLACGGISKVGNFRVDDIETETLRQGLRRVHERLAEMQQKYLSYLDDQSAADSDDENGIVDVGDSHSGLDAGNKRTTEAEAEYASDVNRNQVAANSTDNDKIQPETDGLPTSGTSYNSLESLAKMLKAEISDSVGSLVDEIVRSFVDRHFGGRRRGGRRDVIDEQRFLAAGTADGSICRRRSDDDEEDDPWRRSTSFDDELNDRAATSGQQNSSQTASQSLPPPLSPLSNVGMLRVPSPVQASNATSGGLQGAIDSDSLMRRAAAKLVADRYALQSAAAVAAAYLDGAFLRHHGKTAFEMPPAQSVGPSAAARLFPSSLFYAGSTPVLNHYQSQQSALPYVKEPEQTEALPLVVCSPKKKRTKVTDTRLSPRAARALLQESLHHHHHQLHHQSQYHASSPQDDMQSAGGVTAFCQTRQHHHHHYHQDNPHQLQQQQQQQQQQHRHHSALQHVGHAPPTHIHDAFSHRLYQSTNVPGQPLPPHQSGPHQPAAIFPGLPVGSSLRNPAPTAALEHSWRAAVYGGRDAVQSAVTGSGFERPASQPETTDGTCVNAQSISRGSLLKPEPSAFDQILMQSAAEPNYDGQAITSTLTPMHLRKAKLMFFYVRYPSSTILKDYFPDVRFNKNNTAQLVKWFSNFREFFYIQMEKYARQALNEGVKNVTDLIVTTESELYRVLVLHYNRNNQIEVPESFRFVVQAALREFYLAIVAEKDQEQSWKKAIYKVIARLDEVVPEYFKSSNWLEQLADC